LIARLFRGFRPAPIRWRRPLTFGLLCLAAIQAAIVFLPAIGQSISVGRDFELYVKAAQHWQESGSFYPAHQLSGPYNIAFGDILYPPYVLALLIPFTVIPAAVWWLIPIAVTAFVIAWWRPSGLAWAGVLVVSRFRILWRSSSTGIRCSGPWPPFRLGRGGAGRLR
jgi:hypothetical protein